MPPRCSAPAKQASNKGKKPMHPDRISKPTTARRVRPVLALASLGACLALAACGSSASSSTSTNTASTNTSASSNSAQAPGSSRFTALRSCLAKEGITLPAPSGNRPPAGSGAPGGGGGLKPPSGISTTQFQEALKKCGGGNFGGGRFNSSTSHAALTKYVACMSENGVKLPTPNTSGSGPVFNTKDVNTSSSTFKSAQSKCQSDLHSEGE